MFQIIPLMFFLKIKAHSTVKNVHSATRALLICFVSAQHWLTELEVMASLFAAAIHDYEHTGTTNNFHIHTM